MKKIGLLVFAVAIITSLALVWGITGKSVFSFSALSFDCGSSGNVITEKRVVTGFKGVHASSAMRLEITVGKEFSVELEGDDNILPLIKTEVYNNELYFERQNSRFRSRNRVIARITMPEINNLDVSGATKAIINNVNGEELKIQASGASRIEITGAARTLNVEASGASQLDAENLKTENSKIAASGASKVFVFAAETVNAEASGASKIIYSGNPKTVNKDASGASSISGR